MDEFITRSFRGDLSNVEERMLQKWRLASADNERRYQELARVWEVNPVSPLVGEPPERPSVDQVVTEARRRRGIRAVGRSKFASSRLLRPAAAIAALLLLGIALAEFWPRAEPSAGFGAAELATGRAETATMTLTDGTIVRLAPSSRLRIGGGAGARHVQLDGRAYFAVQSDSSAPFTVRTSAGEVLVLGTRFEIRVKESSLRLAVVEGRVALSTGSGKVELGADEVSHVRDGSAPSVVKVDNVREILDWPDGLLIFRGTPLREVGRELETHFGLPVEITDSRISQRQVTAWFTDESLDEVLTAVCRATLTRCSVEDGRVLIVP